MAKIIRKNQKIFGASAVAGDIVKFGSEAAGSPVSTTDPETIQSGTEFNTGWRNATITVNSQITPTLQDFNSLSYLNTYQLAYLMQQGIPEWETATVYYTNSYCQGSDGKIYRSLTDNNTANNPTTDGGTNWQILLVEANIAFDTTSGHDHDGSNSKIIPGWKVIYSKADLTTDYDYIPSGTKQVKFTFAGQCQFLDSGNNPVSIYTNRCSAISGSGTPTNMTTLSTTTSTLGAYYSTDPITMTNFKADFTTGYGFSTWESYVLGRIYMDYLRDLNTIYKVRFGSQTKNLIIEELNGFTD